MMFLNDRKPARVAAALAATAVLLGAGACSGDTNASSDGTTNSVQGGPALFAVAPLTGTDEEFYLPPDPLP